MQQSNPPEGKPNPVVNSFLNLCRVCPVPTDDKASSEYKRNFTWHDGYQTTKIDVIRNAPSLPSSSSVEPSLPRKKKYPGQPARDHLLYEKGGDEESSSDSLDHVAAASAHHDDASSRHHKVPDEDSKSSSKMPDENDSRKQEDKQSLMDGAPSRGHPGTPGGATEEGGQPRNHSTEYRSQFVAYPRTPDSPAARKSASMGLINFKRDTVDGESSIELWNNMPPEDDDDAVLDAVKRGRIKKTEYKSKFRPFSAYTYVDGNWKKATRLIKDNEAGAGGCLETDQHAWYSEVVERLRKADQYRARSHTGANTEHPAPEFFVRDSRTILSPCSVSSCRTWNDRPTKERGRSGPVPVHQRKDKTDIMDYPKSRDGSTKKKPLVEKTTVRPKSAEPVIPVHKSPKRNRPRAPRDLPVKGHGDLSGRKKSHKQSAGDKGSPVGMKPRAVARGGGEEGKVWLKADPQDSGDEGAKKKEEPLVNGFNSEDSEGGGKMVNGDGDYSVQPKVNGEHAAVFRGPAKVPLTTVKSPEEVTGVRSPDPESWTVPLEVGKGLHWMDGKTPDGVQTKGPPTLLSKRLKESSLVTSQKDMVVCDPGSEATGESVDL